MHVSRSKISPVPVRNKPTASIYLPQLSPMTALRLVYKGSKSMRCAALEGFGALMADGPATPFILAMFKGFKVAIESERVRAAGSMSGMVEMGGLAFPRFPQRNLAELCPFVAASEE